MGDDLEAYHMKIRHVHLSKKSCIQRNSIRTIINVTKWFVAAFVVVLMYKGLVMSQYVYDGFSPTSQESSQPRSATATHLNDTVGLMQVKCTLSTKG